MNAAATVPNASSANTLVGHCTIPFTTPWTRGAEMLCSSLVTCHLSLRRNRSCGSAAPDGEFVFLSIEVGEFAELIEALIDLYPR
jgi:hypothetical protein